MLDLHANYSLTGNDPWYQQIESAKQLNEFCAEVQEMKEEIHNPSTQDELESEIGDVVWDLIALIRKLEDEEKIVSAQVFEKIHAKMARRKPYLLTGEEVSKEQAMDLWNQAKTQEGYSPDRLWTPERERKENT